MGYAPASPFGEGLKATVRWYEQNRGWWEPLRARHPVPGPVAAASPGTGQAQANAGHAS